MDMNKLYFIRRKKLIKGLIIGFISLLIGLLFLVNVLSQYCMHLGRENQKEADASMFQQYEEENILLKTENRTLDSMYVQSQQALRGIMLTKMEEKNAVKHGEVAKKIESEVRP